ncbi:MAG: hypothetical protein V4805_07130 [Pseudomonadota bacterium]
MAADPLATLLTLMQDVEAEDPLDFNNTPVAEDEARKLVALSMLKMQTQLDTLAINPAERELVLMATAGHLVLENFLIHIKHLQACGESGDDIVQALLAHLRSSGSK